jgi:Ca-activated chloride channel family protein
VALLVLVTLAAPLHGQDGDQQHDQRASSFRSGVEIINVTATITEKRGRFVPGLRPQDFTVYEDGKRQPVSQFIDERVQISIGVLLDTSASMAGEKLASARSAIGRLVRDLLNPADQIFLYQFATRPTLIQDWTMDRASLTAALGRVFACGYTSLYDAVAEAVKKAQDGQYQKKAILIVEEGNDTINDIDIVRVKKLVRESEVLVYAIGIEGRRNPFPVLPNCGEETGLSNAPMNVFALHTITDDSGGRTEVIQSAGDLDGVTSRIADELSRQYTLGYLSTGKKDGRWHNIRVEVEDKSLRVRARRGYVATRQP